MRGLLTTSSVILHHILHVYKIKACSQTKLLVKLLAVSGQVISFKTLREGMLNVVSVLVETPLLILKVLVQVRMELDLLQEPVFGRRGIVELKTLLVAALTLILMAI